MPIFTPIIKSSIMPASSTSDDVEMATSYLLAMPRLDGRRREAQAAAAMKADLERRLGPAPSFEARQVAEQLIRTSIDISLLERKRHERGELGSRDHELLMRRENALARLLERLERLAPPPSEPGIAEQLRAERQAAVA